MRSDHTPLERNEVIAISGTHLRQVARASVSRPCISIGREMPAPIGTFLTARLKPRHQERQDADLKSEAAFGDMTGPVDQDEGLN
jgi:hypothetical protein